MRFILTAVLLFFIACNSDEADKQNTGNTSDDTDISAPVLPWVSAYDTLKNEFYLKQQRKVSPGSVDAANMINDINAEWENVKLVLLKVSNDTLYVSIPDSEFLGQQMGSAGAQAYMASTTYNLTEIKGINYVNYAMRAGDHVAPGTFSRKSFENYR